LRTSPLLEALRALPIAQRQVIVLHHLIGMPVGEVAATPRLATGTVKSHLSRGRRSLAGRLSEQDPQEVSSGGA
jgi:RNA polymerase sigma-70 factor, ECF subfamily